VALGFQHGQLFAALFRAAPRHHHGGIPAQQAGSAAEGVQTPEFLFELLIGRQSHSAIRKSLAARPATVEAAILATHAAGLVFPCEAVYGKLAPASSTRDELVNFPN
jgi:hypothetical protein